MLIRSWSLFCSIQIYVSLHLLPILSRNKLSELFVSLCSVFFVCSVFKFDVMWSQKTFNNFCVIAFPLNAKRFAISFLFAFACNAKIFAIAILFFVYVQHLAIVFLFFSLPLSLQCFWTNWQKFAFAYNAKRFAIVFLFLLFLLLVSAFGRAGKSYFKIFVQLLLWIRETRIGNNNMICCVLLTHVL